MKIRSRSALLKRAEQSAKKTTEVVSETTEVVSEITGDEEEKEKNEIKKKLDKLEIKYVPYTGLKKLRIKLKKAQSK